MRFRSKDTFEAAQFLPPYEPLPPGVMNVQRTKGGRWYAQIRNTQGKLVNIQATNWAVAGEPKGRYKVYTDKVFRERFEPVGDYLF